MGLFYLDGQFRYWIICDCIEINAIFLNLPQFNCSLIMIILNDLRIVIQSLSTTYLYRNKFCDLFVTECNIKCFDWLIYIAAVVFITTLVPA